MEVIVICWFFALVFLVLGIKSRKKWKKVRGWPETEAEVVKDLGISSHLDFDAEKNSH